ncbi:hypothetical protein OJ998_22205 [Solirubrobacter taibaiensis]|nr:hypothetical protein [Solirubrobacter taibaiensis]
MLIRQATEDETRAVEGTLRGREFMLEPARSFVFAQPDRPRTDTEVFVVARAFVDFDDGSETETWTGSEHHGVSISVSEDATIQLLELAEEAAGYGLTELLAGIGIAGLGVSRWQLMSAPRRIDLAPDLLDRLAPLRRR